MYIIAGLGNPGKEYMGTRHNAGFSVIDELADKYNISVDTAKHKGLIGKGDAWGFYHFMTYIKMRKRE